MDRPISIAPRSAPDLRRRLALRTALVVAIAAALMALIRMPPGRAERSSLTVPTIRRVPVFSDYPAGEVFAGKPAPVDLTSDANAPTFRTRLRRGASEGPNFAGHYTIVSWGCGTDCQVTAVVDARNGRVTFAPFTAFSGTAFRRESRLLIENPRPQDVGEALTVADDATFQAGQPSPDDPLSKYDRPGYWVWDGTTFAKLAVADPRLR